VVSIQNKNASAVINQLGYIYDADGNIKTETLSPNTTYTYQYNPLNQLASFVCSGTACPKTAQGGTIASKAYRYTLNNGIETMTTHTSKGQTNTATYHYYPHYPDRLKNITNSNNNSSSLETGVYGYDNNGNVTQNAKGDAISYDALNQMLSIKNPSGALIARYAYNGAGKVNQETPAGQV